MLKKAFDPERYNWCAAKKRGIRKGLSCTGLHAEFSDPFWNRLCLSRKSRKMHRDHCFKCEQHDDSDLNPMEVIMPRK